MDNKFQKLELPTPNLGPSAEADQFRAGPLAAMEEFLLYARCSVQYLDVNEQLTWVQNSGPEVLDCASEALLLAPGAQVRCPPGKVLDVAERRCVTDAECTRTSARASYVLGRLCLEACPPHFFKLGTECVVQCPLADGFAPSAQLGYRDVCQECADGELATASGCVAELECPAGSVRAGKTCV